jgi:hypothetical protein
VRVLALLLAALAACSGEDEQTGSASAASAPEPDPRLVPLLTQGPEGQTQEPRIGHATARRICSSVTTSFLAAMS